jgi:hypothetical protein
LISLGAKFGGQNVMYEGNRIQGDINIGGMNLCFVSRSIAPRQSPGILILSISCLSDLAQTAKQENMFKANALEERRP